MVADRLCEGGAELEIIESFLDDDEGLEAVARFLGGELGPECRVAPLEVQDPDGLGVAEDGKEHYSTVTGHTHANTEHQPLALAP